nr:actin-2-like [Cavia porcellus]
MSSPPVGFTGVLGSSFCRWEGSYSFQTLLVGMEEKDWFLGNDAQKKRERLILQYPISRGDVTSWDNLEKIWHHSFYQVLNIPPEEYPLMMTEPPLNSTSTRERVCQILFETFGVPALSLVNQGVLSLYASGLTDADREYIRDVKERCCYVTLDFDKQKVQANDPPSCPKELQLPDGQKISLGEGAFTCPEALFQTNLIGRSTLGIHMMAMQCITSCNPALWKMLFGHIILSGGTGSFSGLRLRLQRELIGLVSPTIEVKVATSPYAKYGAWVGGSILSSLSTFKDMWVTSSEYKDVGCSIISRRSF